MECEISDFRVYLWICFIFLQMLLRNDAVCQDSKDKDT